MRRAALQGLRMVGNNLTAKEEEAHRNKGAHKSRSPRRHNSPRHRSGNQRSRTPSPRRHKSPKHGGTRRSRTPTKAYDYKDDEKEMGASCFTHKVRTTPVPKGFKLPHDQQKYDGSQVRMAILPTGMGTRGYRTHMGRVWVQFYTHGQYPYPTC
jgi:hypothetical protein